MPRFPMYSLKLTECCSKALVPCGVGIYPSCKQILAPLFVRRQHPLHTFDLQDIGSSCEYFGHPSLCIQTCSSPPAVVLHRSSNLSHLLFFCTPVLGNPAAPALHGIHFAFLLPHGLGRAQLNEEVWALRLTQATRLVSPSSPRNPLPLPKLFPAKVFMI